MARKKRDKDSHAAHEASRNGAAADSAPAVEESGGGGLGRLLLLALVATIAALALSEDLRSKVLDMLFGSEEEFAYSSTTMPAQDAPVGVPSS